MFCVTIENFVLALDDFGQCLAHSTPQVTNMNNMNSPSTSSKIEESTVMREAPLEK